MASPAFFLLPGTIRRKPPASEQYNWLSGAYDVVPEQLDLDIPVPDDAILPDDSTVTLLATENGAQLLVAGFGLYIGKKGERIIVKKSRQALRRKGAPQQTVESFRDGVVRCLEGRIDFQDPFAQLL
jgi:hypothetical protein